MTNTTSVLADPMGVGVSQSAHQIAHWRTARGRGGREVDLHPWMPGPTAALKAATIRHCVGCAICKDAVEVDPPCDNPRWCTPERPCAGLHTAQEWARRHVDGTAAAIANEPEEGDDA